jgi:ligand-binding sensor domain-containing protein
MRDGLPDLKIECVKEDSRGVLWIGTHDKGVVCYEGDDFRWFTTRDGLAGNGVFSIVEDNEGCIWFGTNAGLSRTSGDGFESVELGEPCSFLWGGCTDTVGRLWFGLERRPGRPPQCVDGMAKRQR